MITNPRIKKIFLLIILIISCTTTFCQNVGIGTNTPAASAQLDISSTTKGLLTPRMTTVERDAIVSPATGLLIYNTTEGDFNFFNGTAWDKYLKDLDYLEYGLENTTLLNLFNPYEYGQTMTWVVPDGVKQILVNMKGGKGGKATRGALTGNGGDGSSVSAILNVIPGQTIVFSAGSRGADYNNGNLAGNVTTIGGGGGGSSGGTLGTISYGGGGGASKITIDGTVVLVAAGGGGGYVNSTTGLTADGGCGTFPVGCNGGSTASGTSYPGGGGTQTQGGINSFDAALNGTAFQGNARGGGGGYYGGAGGEAAGSGGGSSWSAAGASFGTASYSNGYRGGTINIKYDAHKITTDIVDANEGRFGPLVGLNSQYVLQTSGKSNFNGVVSINDNLGIKEQSPDFPLTFETTLGDKISLYGNTAEAAHYGFGVQSALLQIHSSAINDDIAFGYGSSNSFTERMRIKGNGNVGIGTTSPNAPLQFANTTVSRKIVLWETANNDNQFSGFGVNGNVVRYQSDNANADHVFYSAIDADNSKELVRIKGSGNVGIGNTNPAVKLHITGDEYIDGSLRIRNNATTNNYGKIEHSGAGGNFHLDTYGTGGMYLNYFSGNGVLIGNGASGITATFSTNGNLGIAGTLTQNSDARLKKNIEPLTSSLRKLLQLNGYTYNWVDARKDDKQQIGIIAQEVEKMFPSLVTTNVDGYKSVNYIGLIPVMIESIKEQQSQIDALKKENEDIKKDNIEIKKMINKLLY